MASVKNSPAPAKSGQAKTGTTKAKTAAKAAVKPAESGAAIAPAVIPAEPAASAVGPVIIQAVELSGSAPSETTDPADASVALTGAVGDLDPALPLISGESSLAASAGGQELRDGVDGGSQAVMLPPVTSEGAPPAPDERHEGDVGGPAMLANHSNMAQRIAKAGISLAPGESAVIEFRNKKHREQCEKHVAQLRSLYRWSDSEGLHWVADE